MADTKRKILVAGAEGFLGRHAVLHFHRKGLPVAGSCRRPEDKDELTGWLHERGVETPVLEVANLADDGAVKALIERVTTRLGGLGALFNAAGGFVWTKVADGTAEQARFLWEANFLSGFLLARHAVGPLTRSGDGRLVFISASAALAPAAAGMGLYAASKAALNCLVQALADEHKGTGLTVNALCPTILDTPRNRADMPGASADAWVPVDDLLAAAEYLLSPPAISVNGAFIRVAGKL